MPRVRRSVVLPSTQACQVGLALLLQGGGELAVQGIRRLLEVAALFQSEGLRAKCEAITGDLAAGQLEVCSGVSFQSPCLEMPSHESSPMGAQAFASCSVRSACHCSGMRGAVLQQRAARWASSSDTRGHGMGRGGMDGQSRSASG